MSGSLSVSPPLLDVCWASRKGGPWARVPGLCARARPVHTHTHNTEDGWVSLDSVPAHWTFGGSTATPFFFLRYSVIDVCKTLWWRRSEISPSSLSLSHGMSVARLISGPR
jgi:hypothetical protein